MDKPKLIVAVTGASGAIYAKLLLDKLSGSRNLVGDVALIFSDNALEVWKYELPDADISTYPYKIYDKDDFYAPFASGSAYYHSMIICPCSMGTLGRIAAGISGDLISRAADVMLKERRRLILVTRETPLSLIHINNMKTITEAGGIICPASPSFYSRPAGINDLVSTVTDRVLNLAGISTKGFVWGE